MNKRKITSRRSSTQVRPKFQVGDLVLIKWLDTRATGGWRRLEDTGHNVADIDSVGWVFLKNRRFISLTHSANWKDGWHLDVVNIPTGTIRKIVTLRRARN